MNDSTIDVNELISKKILKKEFAKEGKKTKAVKNFLLEVFKIELYHKTNEQGHYKHGQKLDKLLQDYAIEGGFI